MEVTEVPPGGSERLWWFLWGSWAALGCRNSSNWGYTESKHLMYTERGAFVGNQRLLVNRLGDFWGVPGIPWRRQISVFVCFEPRLDRTKSCPFRLLPWARRWRRLSGPSSWPLGVPNCSSGVGFRFFGVHLGVFVARGKSRFLTF